MQFGIRTLLLITTAVAALCAVVFATPPVVAVPILCAILWICPAFWINGIIYGRGAWRPFFIGGLMAGLMPHMVALYFSVMAAIGLVGGDTLGQLSLGGQWPNLLIAAILLSPGLFALCGGLTGVAVYWQFNSPSAPAPPPPAPGEYLVVSGRLVTTPANPSGDLARSS
jgi:hypothetical protein